MSGEVVELALHRAASPPDERHRLRRFAFQAGINFEAQRVLARMMEQLTTQLDGVLTCRIAYDRVAAEWVEHSIWRPSRAPAGDDVAAAQAVALMRRLGRAD